MQPNDDSALLRQYAEDHSDEAFAALVAGHINLVYSVALRQTGDPHQAEEITQAVFIILAKKALRLRHDRALSSWLFQATRLTASNFLRSESRRHQREQNAFMQSALNEPDENIWPRIAPLLDTAVAALSEKDRRVIVLRFYEGRNMSDVGTALGASEDAAKKRVARALERLRKFFSKRGVNSTTAAIGETISANSTQTAPAALAVSVTALGTVKGTAASASTLALAKGALKLMAWTKAKTAIIAASVVLLTTGTTVIAVKTVEAGQPPVWQTQFDLDLLETLPPQVAIRPSLPTMLSSGTHVVANSRSNKVQGLGQSIPEIFMIVYYPRYHLAQLRFPDAPPGGKFDYIATFAGGVPAQQEAIRQELKRQFGLVGRPETMETNCLLLRVRTENAPGLKRSSLPFFGSMQADSYSAHQQMLWALSDYLSDHLGAIVIDQTGLNRMMDIDFKWDKTPEGLKKSLLDQTGLELVPTNMPVEMLIVEKTK